MMSSAQQLAGALVSRIDSALLAWLSNALQLIVLVFVWPLLFIYPVKYEQVLMNSAQLIYTILCQIIVALLTIKVPQRILLFLNHVNYPFNVEWDKPEVFGFSRMSLSGTFNMLTTRVYVANKARNLTITTADGVKVNEYISSSCTNIKPNSIQL